MRERCSIMTVTVSMLIALQTKYTRIHTQQVFTSGNNRWERSKELLREKKSFFQVRGYGMASLRDTKS